METGDKKKPQKLRSLFIQCKFFFFFFFFHIIDEQ